MNFYDTCALLLLQDKAFDEPFFISSITLQELEHIKTSTTKDAETKYCARKLVHLLDEYCDYYDVILYGRQLQDYCPMLEDTPDNRIITSAVYATYLYPEANVTFITNDLCCKLVAESVGLNCNYMTDQEQDKYGGYREVVMTDLELSEFYSGVAAELENPYDLLLNQYLIIKDNNGNIVDQYKYTENGLKKVHYQIFESTQLGLAKPKDAYQMCLMDSLASNKITVVRGPAGVGKSYLSCSYLFKCLEEGKVDRIVIFCNTVATMGAAKLGFYPGSRDEKLLDSQIGNFLASKMGDKLEVQRMIDEGTLVLLPLSDARGYDTSGKPTAVYITEAQNLDIELMRLALQRIGKDGFCILDGDSDAQVDSSAYAGSNNGLRRVSQVFRGDSAYGEVTLKNIYRSHIAEMAQRL